MKYYDGQDAKIGDVLDLGGEMTGRVVILFKDKIFHKKFPADYWDDGLNDGMMVESLEAGLIHYPETGELRVRLIRRASQTGD